MPSQVPDRLLRVLDAIPAGTGVYIMRDRAGKAIYVGKARSLRSRVRSYFQKGGDDRPNTPFLVERVEDVEVFLTDNEKEALILENDLIKKLKPRYNINLKDDKSFLMVRVRPGIDFPMLELVRRVRRDRALYFGPFSSASSIRDTVSLLSGTLGLRICKDRELANRVRPCPLHEMGFCAAPCVGAIDRDGYHELVDQAVRFLRGDTGDILGRLKESMEAAADELNYERAAELRDRMNAVERSVEHQKMVKSGAGDRDVVALARADDATSFCVLTIRGGSLASESSFMLRATHASDAELVEELLDRYYADDRFAPAEVHVPVLPSEYEGLVAMLTERRGARVTIKVPRRGDPRRLLELAGRNAELGLERHRLRAQSEHAALDELAAALGLLEPPHRIDCFDIANLQGAETVAGMSVLVAGQPAPGLYRHFHVRSLPRGEQDDPRAIAEVVGRRYRRARAEADLPDLALIDGGQAQLAAAVDALRRAGVPDLPVASIAKARGRSGGDRVYVPGQDAPLDLGSSERGRLLLERARDEAHRFANRFHRKTRDRALYRTGLEDIPGVGKRTLARLLREFPSLSEVRDASVDELRHRAGMSEKQARAVHDALERESSDPTA